jgi:hypothetical protein
MPVINLLMFLSSIGSMIFMHVTGHAEPGLDHVLTMLAGASVGAHAGATLPIGGK